jgi:hypothetical protein
VVHLSRIPFLKSEPNPPKPPHSAEEELDDEISWTTIYSAFGPGFTRPVPLESRPPIALPSLSSKITDKIQEIEELKGYAVETKMIKVKADHKPRPYSLPKTLQPKAGTTFSIVNGASTTTTPQSKHVGVLKAILYGVSELEKFSYACEVVAPGSLLNKVLYGVEEMDDGDEKIAVAEVTVPEERERKADGEARPVAKNQEVKDEVEEVLEKEGGAGIVAK